MNPTQGCSIEILHDTCVSVCLRLSMGIPFKKFVCQNVWEELHGPSTCMLKVRFGSLNPPVTPVLFISTIC